MIETVLRREWSVQTLPASLLTRSPVTGRCPWARASRYSPGASAPRAPPLTPLLLLLLPPSPVSPLLALVLLQTEEEEARLRQLERELSVADILLYRSVAQRQQEAAAAPTAPPPVLALPAPPPVLALPAPPPPPPLALPLPATPAVAPLPAPAARGGPSSEASDASASGSQPGSRGGSGHGQQGYIMWGLSKVSSFLGYVPRAEGAAGALPAPSETDMQDLYSAVDFHPEQQQSQQQQQQSQQQQQRGLQLSLDCLVSQAGLVLREGGPVGRWPPAGAASGGGGSACDDDADVAVVELARLRLSVQVVPGKVSAGVTLADATVHDLASEGHGVIERLLGRATVAGSGSSSRAAPPPLLRLQYTDRTKTDHGSQPTLDVLVQALQLRYQPRCVAALLGFVPPVIEGSFASSVLSAVNALSPAARAAIKADHVHQLGPPLDMLVKVSAAWPAAGCGVGGILPASRLLTVLPLCPFGWGGGLLCWCAFLC